MMLRFLTLLMLWVVVEATTNAQTQTVSNVTIPALFVFGDSIMDTGNNNRLLTLIKSNFAPYGKIFPGGVASGRFSDGRVPSDLIAEKLGVAKTLPPYLSPDLKPEDLLKGVTFASGGSGYDPLTSKLTSAISIWDQLIYFKEYISKIKQMVGEEKTDLILKKSVFLVVASSNDIAITYLSRKISYDPTSYANFLADMASKFVKELSGLGARKIGIFSAVSVGCVPAARTVFEGLTRQCAENLNQMALQFNSKLHPALDSLQQELPDGKFVFINVYETLLDIIQHPNNYGFEVADKGCCGTGNIEVAILCNRLTPFTCSNSSAYVFWDSFHPTERTYQVIVEKLLNEYIDDIF